MLKKVIGEEYVNSDGDFLREPLSEAEFARRNSTKPADVLALKRRFLDGSRSFLEDQYLNFMQQLQRSNLKKGQMGGVPTHLSLVKAYLNILFDISPTKPFPDNLEVRLLALTSLCFDSFLLFCGPDFCL